MDYPLVKYTAGALATVGLYSVLYKENKFYRLFEHIFLGLAVGYAIVALWTETLADTWWDKMVGHVAEGTNPAHTGYWAWAFLLPIGLMGYFVFSKKHNWISRIPIGIILGAYAGQQIQIWYNRYGPNIADTMRPLLPTTTESFFKPETTGITDPAALARIDSQVYASQAISNIIFVATVLCVLSYFLFSFDVKSKFLRFSTNAGRMALMIGFGAIFGSTVMMRFTLLIDRMYFIVVEWLQHAVLHMK